MQCSQLTPLLAVILEAGLESAGFVVQCRRAAP